MTLRRLIFWLHLSIGSIIGLVIAFLAATGSILAFQSQIVEWAEHGARIATPSQSPCVAPSALLENAANAEHRSPMSLTLFPDPHRPAEVAFAANAVVLIDGCDGRVIGTGASRLRGFFGSVRDLHRWIAWNGVRHETLRKIKNACVLAFLVLIASGLVLWFPRKISWQHLRPAVLFRRNLRGRAREWNWHTVFGFWLSLPLFMIALTGTIMAYGWANTLLYRVAGSPVPAERAEPGVKQLKPLNADKFPMLDASIRRAMLQDAAWKSLSMRLPSEKDSKVTFTLDDGDGGRPQQRAQLVLSLKDGHLVQWQPFAMNTRGRQWRLYARYLHTGELFGIVGRFVAFVAALSALLLVWTGFSLASRRLFSWRRRREAPRRKDVPATAQEIAHV